MFPNLLNMLRIGQGSAGGAKMSPSQQKAQTRVDDYRDKGWAADDTIDMDLWNQQSGAQGGVGPPAPQQQGQMFGQFGDPKKAMGNIWDQIKGGAGKLKEGISNIDKKMEENYASSGWAPEGYKSPYDKSEDTPEYTPGGSKTLDDIKSKEDAVAQAEWQESPEGEEFLENMRSGQRVGDYAVGNATMGGPFGGILNSLFSKPWSYEVKPRHKYGSLK
tara:strand:- start:9965 stop:10618 length:654 start_codon:yes stop_codon:yes gene_type:complete